MHPDPSSDPERRREPNLPVAVVQAVGKAVEADQLLEKAGAQAQGEESVHDRAAEPAGRRSCGIDMDPLAILGRLSESVDLGLIDLVPAGRPEHGADEIAEGSR